MSTRIVPHTDWVLTARQCREMDAETINSFGIDGFTLMEIAGTHTGRHLVDRTEPGHSGLIFCGKGNNAGDALVAARYLLQQGRKISVVFLSGTGDLSEDTAKNLSLLKTVSESDDTAAPLSIVERWEDFGADIRSFDFIVDGMLGTGLDSELRKNYLEATGLINRAGSPVFAIDIPTGLHADSGEVLGDAVRADETFTYGAVKQGFYLNEGPARTGSITYCELPFPNFVKKKVNTFLISRKWARADAPGPARHKYEAGVLYVIAGSEGLTGAALMSTLSAWYGGLGAVIWICPRGLLPRVESRNPQIIKRPVGEEDDLHFRESHAGAVRDILAEKEGKAVLGPGLGREEATADFVGELASTDHLELLVDADALRALAKKGTAKPGNAEWILTPHPGELGDLLGEPAGRADERLKKVHRYCETNGITVLSKGDPSIVGTPEGYCYITNYDTRVFSRAGFGDVLAGKIAAYWTRGHSAPLSCALAMLEGKERIDRLTRESRTDHPEPPDLI